MKYLLVSGGTVSEGFVSEVIKKGGYDVVMAADSGMDFLYRVGILPDIIVGDFDSVDEKILTFFKEKPQIEICSLNPQKDDTDTEHAIHYAIEHGASSISILGGTGKRMDHFLGNVSLLGIGLEEAVSIELLDANNRIRMVDRPVRISKAKQFGKYLSLIPYSGIVKDITVTGVKYPLNHEDLGGFNARGVSNEIIAEEAVIKFSDGILLVIESKD